MKQTALYSSHLARKAKMVPFADWQMPLYYDSGAIEEHLLVRRSAGLFDVSHMGRFEIEGVDSLRFLDRVLTSAITSLEVGFSCYGLLLNEQGFILDDVFLYRLQAQKWMLVVNASNREKDCRWLEQQATGFDVSLVDRSDESSLFALQGPKVIESLGKLLGEDLSDWARFSSKEMRLGDIDFWAGRTGYTGEDGIEIFVQNDVALALWERLLTDMATHCEIGVCGLASRDSLRFEPGFPLYGHEIDETIKPPQALLKWACDMNSDFIGKEAVSQLLQEGLTNKLVSFELLDKGIARENYEVFSADGTKIGRVTTGLYAPTLGKYCGNAYVQKEWSAVGQEIFIDIRGKHKRAQILKRPLYKPSYR